MNPKPLALILSALAASLSCTVSSAQASSLQDDRPAAQEADYSRLADSRNRESMRIGEHDVLISVGTTHGGNELREQSSRLLQSMGELALPCRGATLR